MEWEDYYENYLLFNQLSMEENPEAAAIIGHDGKVWAQTTDFPQLSTEEINAIMREFDEPGTLTIMGLCLGGTKYVVTAVEPDDVIRARKGDSVTIKKTIASLVIGIYHNPLCHAVVERVGNYLIKRGY